MTPQGWLRDPNGLWMLHFLKAPIATDQTTNFYIDKWEASSVGSPKKFLDRRVVSLVPAMETWQELIASGWSKLDNQFSNAA